MSTITFPDGSVATSNAYTPDTLLTVLQPITCGMLGINPPNYNKVRIEWPQTGQPAFKITDDVCFLRVVEEDDEYAKQRDDQMDFNGTKRIRTITYVMFWRVYFDLYGPNCHNNARWINSALLMQWSHDQCETNRLYVNPKIERPKYLKETREGQWWPRASFSAVFSNPVTETVDVQTILSTEILLYDATGFRADVVVENPKPNPDTGFGVYDFGEGAGFGTPADQ